MARTPVDVVIPIVALPGEDRVGWVVRRYGYRQEELYCEVTVQMIPALVPCRWLSHMSDPFGVYVLEDGSLWRSAWPQHVAIYAAVV
ncbi:MAG: hypothetical protein OWQ57_08020, partial [Sulfobacillus sp.]|nr:hypothetical protein [Sulfobacillus sp.]